MAGPIHLDAFHPGKDAVEGYAPSGLTPNNRVEFQLILLRYCGEFFGRRSRKRVKQA
jgi:hypothetical protein